MRSLALLLVAGLAIGALTACGGDGGDGGGGERTAPPTQEADSAREALSKAEFVRRANRRCARTRRELLGPKFRAQQRREERAMRAGRPPPPNLFFGRVVARAMRDLVRELRALPAPTGDEEEVKAILDAARRGVRRLRSKPASVESVRPPFRITLESGRTLKRASVLARRYGLERCAT